MTKDIETDVDPKAGMFIATGAPVSDMADIDGTLNKGAPSISNADLARLMEMTEGSGKLRLPTQKNRPGGIL